MPKSLDGVGNVADPRLWAEQGGVLGLIILGLFLVLLIICYGFYKAMMHESEKNRDERGKFRDDIKQMYSQGADAQKQVASAITELTVAIRTRRD